jgi:hypothetical protein
MPKRNAASWINNPKIRQILLIFSTPKTPRQAEKELSVKKLKLKPFLEQHLLRCLNPDARKGRFYILTDKARECLKPNCHEFDLNKDWELIGWIMSSPRQRLVVLRSVNQQKLISEEIRMNATQLNSHLTRESTKVILKDLGERKLTDSEILERLRFYWITKHGKKIKDDMAVIAPLSPAISGI